jgi:hypothetical protein
MITRLPRYDAISSLARGYGQAPLGQIGRAQFAKARHQLADQLL